MATILAASARAQCQTFRVRVLAFARTSGLGPNAEINGGVTSDCRESLADAG